MNFEKLSALNHLKVLRELSSFYYSMFLKDIKRRLGSKYDKVKSFYLKVKNALRFELKHPMDGDQYFF